MIDEGLILLKDLFINKNFQNFYSIPNGIYQQGDIFIIKYGNDLRFNYLINQSCDLNNYEFYKKNLRDNEKINHHKLEIYRYIMIELIPFKDFPEKTQNNYISSIFNEKEIKSKIIALNKGEDIKINLNIDNKDRFILPKFENKNKGQYFGPFVCVFSNLVSFNVLEFEKMDINSEIKRIIRVNQPYNELIMSKFGYCFSRIGIDEFTLKLIN